MSSLVQRFASPGPEALGGNLPYTSAGERVRGMLGTLGAFARIAPPARWATALLVVTALGCGPSIEQERPVPEYRLDTCESWCSMMFDPVCPAQEVEVKTEAECMEVCTYDDTRWGYEREDKDACAETYIPYVECLAMLPCDELQTHFALANEVPTEQRSSCGGDLRAQLDCQLPYQ